MVYRVAQKDLQKGAKVEQQEHRWASEQRARKIARDHLAKYGPGYYRAEKFNERVVHNVNQRMGARPMRRPRPQPRPVTGFSGTLL